MGAGQHQAHALALFGHVQQVGAQDGAGTVDLAGDLLLAGQDRFGAAQLHDHGAALHAHDGTRDDGVLAAFELVEQQVALAFAQALHDHLLGDVGHDPTQAGQLDGLLIFKRPDLAGLAIDGQGKVAGLIETLVGGLHQRLLDIIHDDFFVETALAADGVDQAHELGWIHVGLSSARGCRRAQKKRGPGGPRRRAMLNCEAG